MAAGCNWRGSESHVRVLEVDLPGGETLVIPRANIEVPEK